MGADFRNILVRGVDSVGTFVLATPFYRELRRNFPATRITLCVKPLVAEFARACPYVDEVIIYDAKTLARKIGFIRALASRSFDAAFVISGSFHSALVCRLAGIKERIGYPHDRRRFLLTRAVKEDVSARKHCVEYLLDILLSEGCSIADKSTEIWFSRAAEDSSARILSAAGVSDGERFIGAAFGVAGESARKWPTENWAPLIKSLLASSPLKIILFGNKSDIAEADTIMKAVADPRLLNLVGKTSLGEFAACVKRCSSYVSVDTGGIHVAAALGVPVVGLYVPGSDDRWGPRPSANGRRPKVISKKTPCSPCDQSKMRRCRDNKCMRALTVEEVASAVTEIAAPSGTMPRPPATELF
ncbi:MAG: lipopolysaccharide heptosyltransferase II [Endomicrobiia bacterium]|nr:lipopolysaccharide heptosyltransferase II [Endomicrobiia bacterium]